MEEFQPILPGLSVNTNASSTPAGEAQGAYVAAKSPPDPWCYVLFRSRSAQNRLEFVVFPRILVCSIARKYYEFR
jgi:hypothetical protein